MAERPTDDAKRMFEFARIHLIPEGNETDSDRLKDLSIALSAVCTGLMHLSTGLRATYMLLEQVQADLRRP